MKCVKCRIEIDEQADTGRPKSYCSLGCRRAAEHEIRRINHLLQDLESMLSKKRIGWGASSVQDIEKLESEIYLQDARLRALLDANDEEPKK